MTKTSLLRFPGIRRSPTWSQQGLTLVELLVAMAIGLVVVLAAAAVLLTARQGFTALDATSQLRDNARFAADFIQRLALQAGYVDPSNTNVRHAFQSNIDALQASPISGYDNATPARSWNGTAPGGVVARGDCSKSNKGCGDVLILSNQVSLDVQAGQTNQAMINCLGATPGKTDNVLYSVFYVDLSTSGEPALMCRYKAADKLTWGSQPVVEGVENFQVLYGVNGVTPGAASSPATRDPHQSMPTRYLRADELTAATPDATLNNWRRVRSLRIGLVLRGPPGSAIAPRTDTLYPLGQELASGQDAGSQVSPAAINDTRLRRVVTFTVQLRNYQGLQGT